MREAVFTRLFLKQIVLLNYTFTNPKAAPVEYISFGFVNYHSFMCFEFRLVHFVFTVPPSAGLSACGFPQVHSLRPVPPSQHTASSVFTSTSFLLVPFLLQSWRLGLLIGFSRRPLCPPHTTWHS